MPESLSTARVARHIDMEKMLVSRFAFLGFSLLIIILDQLSKWAVTEHILRPQSEGRTFGFLAWLTNVPKKIGPVEVQITSFFNLVMVWNQGVSFGMFSHDSSLVPVLLILLSLVITLVFTIWLFRSTSFVQSVAISLVIGGALGNVIDRARFGAVIDFLDFHIMGYHWPAFNLADSCIVVGILTVITYSLFFEKTEKQ